MSLFKQGFIGNTINNLQLDTDKNRLGGHTYGPVYDEILKDFFDKEIDLMEIGVWTGGSCALWNHVFPKGNFTYIDIVNNISERNRSLIDPERNQLIIGNAYTEEILSSINKKFDIIIDDGSHGIEDLVFFAFYYHRFLKDGGLLILEDVPGLNFARFINSMFYDGFVCQIFDRRHFQNRPDDIMVVIKKNYLTK